MISDEPFTWVAGISDGDMQNFTFTGSSAEEDLSSLQAVRFNRPDFPEGLLLSEDGLLSGTPSCSQKITEFQVIATDQNHISDFRPFQLSSRLYMAHSISAGDDSLINQNEQVTLDLTIRYIGNDTLHNARIIFSVTDKNITLMDSSEYIGLLSPDATLDLAGAFRFITRSDIPDLYTIQSSIDFLSDEQNWQKSLNLQACAPLVASGDMVVEDQEDHLLEPGENAELNIKINNFGHSVAHGVSCHLSCQDPYISFNESLCLDYGDIQSRVNTSREINVTANPHTPPGHINWIYFDIYDTTGFILTDSIHLLISPTQILIVDLDPNVSSGPVIRNAIAENMIVADYRDYIPWWDLYKYDAIFLCLGVFPLNYILETPDADDFVIYLNQGGHLYLEGGATWYYDDPTALQPMFHITGDHAAWSHKPDTLAGQSSTLTQGMSFDYTGENIRLDNLEGIEPASCIFRDKNNGFGFAVSYDAEVYKTIGTSFEFGGLTDSVYPSTKAELMRRYLEFFNIKTNDIAANFMADTLTLLTGTRIQFHDFSTDDVQSWSWTFPGGTPEVSFEREPVISYSMAGIFDVTLSVSNGNQSDMLTKNHYITVVSGQGAQEDDDPFEMSIYPNPSNGSFTLIMNSMGRMNLSMKIFNNTGQVVFEKVSSMIPGRYRETIDLMEQPAGIYFILLQDGSHQSVSKMILLK
ncbi:MAG: T9SS type A sorting domain-containing protein [Bacteroidetes bacterium]|nr:T9SS type A sorting domain-containing protein [Bacteroidota bacterium]